MNGWDECYARLDAAAATVVWIERGMPGDPLVLITAAAVLVYRALCFAYGLEP